MYVLAGTPAVFILLYALSRVRSPAGWPPCQLQLRAEARGWLGLLSFAYLSNALCFIMLSPLGVSDEVALCVQWVRALPLPPRAPRRPPLVLPRRCFERTTAPCRSRAC